MFFKGTVCGSAIGMTEGAGLLFVVVVVGGGGGGVACCVDIDRIGVS